ncbi:MAG: DUF11 domain-containing protein [Anaerolineae bacterium]|nr:DUF11 domain-containing protein [Anaerolineae bacterium]
MKTVRWINSFVLLMLLPLFCGTGPTVAAGVTAPDTPQARTTPLIIDHTSVDITAVPQEWIEEAKRGLHIAYGHTSHGSQLTDGMSGLVGFANGGGLGLVLPDDIFDWNEGGTDGALDLDDYAMGGDVGYYPDWVNNTISYLGTPDPVTGRGQNHPNVNVIMWSWCGQASWYTEENITNWYLAPMTQLELDYPGITFVYMTGHSDGTGEEGDLHLRNQQIRDYCISNNKVLYDFYDIELYDPDGVYYGDRYVLDSCQYDGNGNGDPWDDDTNWALDWQATHTVNEDWYSCSCAHSQSLNCNQKAYAVWTLWARLAGWDGGISALEASKAVSQAEATPGETITYTVAIQASRTPPTGTVTLNDTVPAGLAYIPGTLTATSGAVDDVAAPDLTWTGLLTPTPAVTVTYAVTVATTEWRSITNTVVIVTEGQEPLTRTATVQIVRPADYPDLTPSFKTVSTPMAYNGDRVTYTVGIRNATGPLSLTAVMSDVIRPGLAYIPGTFTATSGEVDEMQAPLLQWTGVLSPTPDITLTYAAVVTPPVPVSTIILPSIVINQANIAVPGYQTITRSVTLKLNMFHIYLPMVVKSG